MKSRQPVWEPAPQKARMHNGAYSEPGDRCTFACLGIGAYQSAWVGGCLAGHPQLSCILLVEQLLLRLGQSPSAQEGEALVHLPVGMVRSENDPLHTHGLPAAVER